MQINQTSLAQARASSLSVLHGTILQCCLSVITPLKYGHFVSGIGFIHTTDPARFSALARATSARFKSTVFASLRTSSTVDGPSTAGCADTALASAAQACEEDVEGRMDKLVSMIEPTLVGVLSVVIGAVLLSVMLPMAGIISSIL